MRTNATGEVITQWINYKNIDRELVKMGIPKEDIVLGFQAPYLRQYTEFGVANR
ncbi:MAG: element excision factor XisI family protein [Geitlerinemataceae cyanobacterium]